jgi:hypothetical protein
MPIATGHTNCRKHRRQQLHFPGSQRHPYRNLLHSLRNRERNQPDDPYRGHQLFGMKWRGTSHRHENRELLIRRLLTFVREKKEFLRMSLMKLPGHASDSLSENKENFMKLDMLKSRVPAGVMFLLLSFVTNNLLRFTPVAAAEAASSHCVPVGGALMTNIGAIAGVTNLGPASGDLAGSLAATILGQNSNGTYNVQHYWVTAAGETITLKRAVLTPAYPTNDPGIVAVPWGNYRSYISGGTGKFEGASGYLDYFGMADFHQNTLVLRYRGHVCYAVASE